MLFVIFSVDFDVGFLSTSQEIRCKIIPEITYLVSGGTLNSNQSTADCG